MQHWQVGDVSITRIIETEDTSMAAAIMVPDATPENLAAIDWLRPHFVDPDGNLISSIFALLVESQGKRIVIDTCVGNDKQRGVPGWNQRQGDFLEQIAAAGFPRESIDFVICTHLHPDHVGWNTLLEDGEWRPTFPNARYLFSKLDWEWLDTNPVGFLGDYAGDSIRPIFAAGLADVYEPDHQITPEVAVIATHGHSPGHVSVLIRSGADSAVVTGDLMHHPCQIAEPDWCSPLDFDSQAALATRRSFLEKFCDADTLVIGTHFATPTAGHIVTADRNYRLKID